ncbi:hypothetical protein AAC387_Pa11g1156 [Persea americana]
MGGALLSCSPPYHQLWRGRTCGEGERVGFDEWQRRQHFSFNSAFSLPCFSPLSLNQRWTLVCSPLSRCPAAALPLSRLISPPSRPAVVARISVSPRLISPPRRTAVLVSSPLAELRASLSLSSPILVVAAARISLF